MTTRQFIAATEPLTTADEILLHENPVHASLLGLDRRAIVEQGYVPSDNGPRTGEVITEPFKDATRKDVRGKVQPQAAYVIVHEDRLPDVIRVLKSIQRDHKFPIVEKGALSKAHSFEKDENGYVSVALFANFSDKEKARLESKGGNVTMTTRNEVGRAVLSSKARVSKETGVASYDM